MQAPVTDKYTYDAKVVNVVDGDTIRCHADLGFGITYDTQNLRLARINTPELKGESREAALAAKEALKNLIGDKTVLIRTLKNRRDRYGRYMCEVWVKECETDEGSWVNVSDWLWLMAMLKSTFDFSCPNLSPIGDTLPKNFPTPPLFLGKITL